MQFSTGRPDSVRAINQRWLLKFWKNHLGMNRIPRWQAVKTDELIRISSSLSFLDVNGDGASARFQIRYYGDLIAKAYGLSDFRGKFLDEIVSEHRRAAALAPYQQALACGCPIYTIHDLTDRNGRLVHFERLLLPFSSDGGVIERILTSYEFVAPDGAYECDSLLVAQEGPSELKVSIIIEPQTLV